VEAELRSNLDRNTLILVLKDAEIETGDGLRSVLPGITEQEIPLRYASAREMKEDSPTQVSLGRMPREIEAQYEAIESLERVLAADVGLALVTGDLHTLGEQSWKPRRKALAEARNRLHKLQTEPWRRWASGFSCLCFVMVGVPLAILWRKADVMSTFAVCFIPILCLYYPLLAFGLDRAKAGALPPYTVWAANLLLVAIGLYLLRRVIRY
jgi:lipopolysaccharide export system permease protein